VNAVTTSLRRGQHQQAADTLVASHANYPAFRHIFPDPRSRIRALRPFFAATVRDAIPFGGVYAATDTAANGTDAMAAVAVWLPPGAFPWSAARQARAVPTLMRTMIAAPKSFPTFTRLGSNAARAHPVEPHWYLVVLGVHPEHQGYGHGSRLVVAGLDHADRDGTASYLETSDPANVAFYKRFGFTVVENALHLVPNGPTHIAMRRPAVRR
jgi:ribosomal protein S18 acetylase RimI-like enzyme